MAHAPIDPAVVQRIKQGDAEALRRFAEEQGPDLYGFFRRAVRSHETASELAIEALCRLLHLQAPPPLREGERARLYRIAHALLKKARDQGLGRESDPGGLEPVPAAVAALPPLAHDLLFLRLGVGLSLPGVSFVLGIPHEPVRQQMRQQVGEPLAWVFANQKLGGCALGGPQLVANVLDALGNGEQMLLASHLSGCEPCRDARTKIEQQLLAAAALPPLENVSEVVDRFVVRMVTNPAPAEPPTAAGYATPEAAAAGVASLPPPPPPAVEPPPGPPIDWRIHVGLVAAALVLAGGAYLQVQRLSVPPPRIEVGLQTGASCSAGAPAGLRVSVVDRSTGLPVPGAQVVVALAASGKTLTLAEAPTPAGGALQTTFTCPALPEGSYPVTADVRVGKDSAASATSTLQVVHPVKLALTSDKPLYKPGQTLRIRALARESVAQRIPADEPITFVFVDGKGNKVGREVRKLDAYGVASVEFPLATEVLLGAWRVEASVGKSTETLEVTVDRYDLPQFEVKATTEKRSYPTGATVSGRVDCRYFFGKPVAGATVELDLADERGSVGKAKGVTDEGGTWAFQLSASKALRRPRGSAPLRLTAKAKAKTGETVQKQQALVVLDEALDVHTVLEDGAWVPGYPSRLFVMVVRPDGEIVPRARVSLSSHGQPPFAAAETGEQGIAILELDRSPRGVQVRAAAPDGAQVALMLDLPQRASPAVVRTGRVFFNKGEAITGEVVSALRGTAWEVALVREGQVVGLGVQPMADTGRTPFRLAVPAGVEGALSLSVRPVAPGGEVGRDDRPARRQMEEKARRREDWAERRRPEGVPIQGKTVLVGSQAALTIGITGDADDYRPGKEAKLTVRVVDESGKPAVANVGLSVVDESVFALVDKDPAALRTAFLLSRQLLASKLPLEPGKIVKGDQNTELSAEMLLSLTEPAAPVLSAGWGADPEAWKLIASQGKALEIAVAAQASLRGLLFLLALVAAIALAGRVGRGLGYLVGALGGILVVSQTWGPHSYPLAIALGMLCLVVAAGVGEWHRHGAAPRIAALAVPSLFVLVGILWLGRAELRYLDLERDVPWLALGGERQAPTHGAESPQDKAKVERKAMTASKESQDFAPPPAPPEFAGLLKTMGGARTSDDGAMGDLLRQALGGKAAPAIDKASTRVRSWFPETMFWSSGVITGADGTATLTVPVADSITTWRISAQGSAADGRMGTGRGSLRVMQDFFVEVDLPVALVVGDEVELPIAVHNYLQEPQQVRVEVEKADWYEALSGAERVLSLAPGEVGSAPVRIRARQFGARTLTVWSAGTKLKDAVRRQVEVLPNGVLREQAQGGVLADQAKVVAKLPEGFVPGSGKAFLRFYPGPVSSAMEGIEALLQAPHGCFEQTSATTYPNALVLRYLKDSGKQNVAAEARARELLRDGYQRLVTFEIPGGGFEWFGRPPANRVLTAYGLLEFTDMKEAFPVEEALLERTRRWLVGQQAGDGSWAPDAHRASGVVHTGDPVATTAYVAWALAESGYQGPALDRAARWLEPKVQASKDPYVLALAANVWALTGRDAKALAARLEKLGARDAEGRLSFAASGATAMVSRGDVARIEATALAAVALQRAGEVGLATSTIDWLMAARDGRGAWHSTQATVLALRAILSAAGKGSDGDADVTVRTGAGEQKVQLRPDNADLVQTLDVTRSLAADGTLEVNLSRSVKGRTLWQLSTACYQPKPRPPQDLLVAVDWGGKKALLTGEPVEARAQVRWQRRTPAGMVVVALPVPAAFQPEAAALEKLVEEKTIARYSIEGRRVIVYLDGMAPQSKVEFGYRLKSVARAKVTALPAFVALFYEPEVQAHSESAALTVN